MGDSYTIKQQTTKEMEIKRYPRPQGLTALALRYNANPTKANKAKLNKAILTHYLQGTLLYPYPNYHQSQTSLKEDTQSTPNKKRNKITKNPTHTFTTYQIRAIEYKELILMIGLSDSKVQRMLTKFLGKQGESYLTEKAKNDIISSTRATLLGQFFGSLNRLKAQEGWQDELKATSRAWGYKPSIVKEANSAIATSNSMVQNLFNMGTQLIKGLEPSQQGTNIQNNYYGTQPIDEALPITEAGYPLTTTKALQLMEQKGLLTLPTSEEHEALKSTYLGSDIPSVQALPEDAQGVAKKELVVLRDSEAQAIHEERREEGLEALNPIDPN